MQPIFEPGAPLSWPSSVQRSIALGNCGLEWGDGTNLIGLTEGSLALAADGERAFALLSIVKRGPVEPETMTSIEAAAAHWQRGDRALANLRLIFSRLPVLQDPGDAERLAAAAMLLDHGMTPAALLKELGLPPLRASYDPEQPRVPAGHGIESGRWTSLDGLLPPITLSEAPTRGTRVAANDEVKPAGEAAIYHDGPEPLDPKQLNGLLSPVEQQAVADTINIIRHGTEAEIKALQPHPFRNMPHSETGAILPLSIIGYTAYSIAGSGRGPLRGESRVLKDAASGLFYYTNTHYISYYPIQIAPVQGKTK